MATNGKLEAQITVPSGGWDLELTDQGAGPLTVTIPEGTYYHDSEGTGGGGVFDFADQLANVANAAMSELWAVSASAGEGGTGKYTIGCAGATCTVTFTDTDARDLMGFTGNLVGSTSYTSPDHAQGLWLPDYPFQSLNGGPAWSGWWETDQQNAENPNGNAFSIIGRKKQINRIDWNFASRAKAWAVNEVTTNESFETFLLDGIWAGAPWGTSAGPIRFYGDADEDKVFETYAAFGLENWRPEQVRPGWVHGWVITLPRLIKVPE